MIYTKDSAEETSKCKECTFWHGWNNLICIVSVLGIVRYAILSFFKSDISIEIPFSNISSTDFIYFILFSLFNYARAAVLYKILEFNIYINMTFIAISEIALYVFIMYTAENIYIRGWSYTFTIIMVLKLISFCINKNKDFNINEDKNNNKSSQSKNNNKSFQSKNNNKSLQSKNNNQIFANNINNVNFIYFLKFLIMPALFYKNNYNFQGQISFKIITRKCISFIFYFLIFMFILNQHSMPALYEAAKLSSPISLFENSTKLGISTIILFNLFFHIIYNCALPIFLELVCCKEPTYDDWWNSTTASEFWSKWNIPVHHFFKYHIYIPLLKKGYSKFSGRSICFILSGILHELVAALALKKITGWLFLAIVGQILLIYITDKVKKYFPKFANTFFWISLCVIGQPAIVILFYHSNYIANKVN